MAQRASTYVVETGDESGLILLLVAGGAAAAFFAWKEGWFGPKSVANPIPLRPGKPAQVGTIKVLPGPPVSLGPRTPVKLGPAKKAPGPPIKLQPSNPVKLGPSNPVKLGPSNPVKLGPGRPIGLEPGKPIALKPSNPIPLGPRTPVKLQPGLTKPVHLQPGLTKPVPLQPHAPSPPLLKPLPMMQPQCLQSGNITLSSGFGLQRTEPDAANCHAIMPGFTQAYWGTFYGSKTGWKGHFTDTSAKTCAQKFTSGIGACDPRSLPPTGSVR